MREHTHGSQKSTKRQNPRKDARAADRRAVVAASGGQYGLTKYWVSGKQIKTAGGTYSGSMICIINALAANNVNSND